MYFAFLQEKYVRQHPYEHKNEGLYSPYDNTRVYIPRKQQFLYLLVVHAMATHHMEPTKADNPMKKTANHKLSFLQGTKNFNKPLLA